MRNANISEPVAADFQQVDQAIMHNLSSKVPLVENIGLHIISSGGKRLRPLLALLCAKACGYEGNHHVTLAAVIEYIHTATLLHDDVVDESNMRRGNPTVNNKWDNSSSVLVGDFLYSRAFEMLVNIGSLTVMQTLSHASSTIAEGEVKQLMHVKNPDTSEPEYFQIIHGKTAMLFEAACKTGAELADASPNIIECLRDYGCHLGMAFQLIDDVMDYTLDLSTMGKNAGDDLREGKTTLPLIHAMTHCTEEEKKMIRKAIRQGDTSQMEAIMSILNNCGSLTYTRQLAQVKSESAIAAIKPLPASPFKESLITLCEQALSRNH